MMALEDKISEMNDEIAALARVVDGFHGKIELKITDSIDSDRIARSLESIADSLSTIARDFR